MPSILDLSALTTFFQYFTALFGAFLAALWLSMVFWTYRDIRARTQDKLIHVLAALITALMGPFGLVIYLILRPLETMEQTYQRTLEEESLLTELESTALCPGCGLQIQDEWQVCPSCHTHLRKACTECGRMMELQWQVCPYCGTPAPGVRTEAEAAGLAE